MVKFFIHEIGLFRAEQSGKEAFLPFGRVLFTILLLHEVLIAHFTGDHFVNGAPVGQAA